ncbi:4-aminobutyrate--2-oxoglutarate transaminase [Nonomuraea jabiensis]|uniref:4-aminobutyrate aminotransferase n=1 Tax=Nonomuraea jabiensis TaxID=882448 RepID=A0A7W9G6S2_9ACTN|nr:4-aminobutyrate--2-oxoglutarate transaminase [Nonomuraea jabiensis]MBB5778194.1 4-aminobutyrate aminotransferase/(S)-3-amino-2-methylpropionate transaminase [Nonomuraea jabiensis]
MSIPQERRVVTAIPGPKSQELLARKQAAVPPGIGTTLPVFVTRAGGGVVQDADGNSLIDFGSGIAVTNVGNAAPKVVERVQRQVADFTHTCFMVTPYESYVRVCEKLNELTPGEHEKRTFLVNSGAEAVENAVKIARHATGRQAVVVFDHGYHGRTLLTMTLTAKNMPYKHGFGPFAPEVYRVPLAYPYRWPSGPENCAEEAAAQAIDMITKQIGPGNVAAVVIEPIAGEGGFIEPAKGFLPRIAEFCKANGIVFVADEVQTGFARTGDLFACEDEGVVPDIITTAKGIAGGLPLAAVTGRAEIMDKVHVGGLGGTYGGNPLACEAALGVLETIEEEGLVAKARRIGEIMLPRLKSLQERFDVIGDVRGRGAMIAIELVEPGTKEPNPTAVQEVVKRCHAEGLLVLTAGTYGNVLRFLPPLVIPEHLLEEGLGILEKAIAEL